MAPMCILQGPLAIHSSSGYPPTWLSRTVWILESIEDKLEFSDKMNSNK